MMRMILAGFALGYCLLAQAGLDEGIAELKAGRYERALLQMQPLAENGDPVAQTVMGLFYERGLGGLKADPQVAARWYQLAAAQGVNVAQLNLGVLYAQGQVAKPSAAESSALFANRREDAQSQYLLGMNYLEGSADLPQDQAEAARWLRKAAEAGHVEAAYHLGLQQARGAGVMQDYVEARRWLLQAAARGHGPAQIALGRLYLAGAGVAPDAITAYALFNLARGQGDVLAVYFMRRTALSSMQLQRAQQLSRELARPGNFMKALVWRDDLFASRPQASGGVPLDVLNDTPDMHYELAQLCLEGGDGVPRDYPQAIRHLREAAAQGHAQAAFQLGELYANGSGVSANWAEAANWFKQAAASDHPAACSHLAAGYAAGQGGKRDVVLAAALWLHAEHLGDRSARFEWRRLLLTPQQTTEAFQLSRELAVPGYFLKALAAREAIVLTHTPR